MLWYSGVFNAWQNFIISMNKWFIFQINMKGNIPSDGCNPGPFLEDWMMILLLRTLRRFQCWNKSCQTIASWHICNVSGSYLNLKGTVEFLECENSFLSTTSFSMRTSSLQWVQDQVMDCWTVSISLLYVSLY